MIKTTASVPESSERIAIEARLSGMSPEKLKFRFFECAKEVSNRVLECALCIKHLKRHGNEYLAGMPMVGTYLRIAEGQIDPEAFWQFLVSPNRTKVERLPLSDQHRLASDPMVEVVVPLPNGKFDKQKVDFRKAPTDLARLVVGPDGIRSPEEQLTHLAQEKAQKIARPKPAEDDEDVATKEPLNRSITVKLTESEHTSLIVNAAKKRKKPAELARRMLLKSGILDEIP